MAAGWGRLTWAAAALALGLFGAAAAVAQTRELQIALQDDPDSLDPAESWSFVGRHVLQAMCDKLVDLDQAGGIVPMLATGWSWSGDGRVLTLRLRPSVVFQDGTAFDAEAVKFNLERSLTLKTSRRRAEIDAIDRVEVTDPLTVRILLKAPSVPLLSALTDRAGMMVSPTAARAAGEAFARNPVCAGPYRFVEHRAQDRVVLERFPNHWRAKDFSFDRLIFRGMPDSNVRLANLRAGGVQLIERLGPSDIAAAAQNKQLQVIESPTFGYFGVTFNIANGDGAPKDAAKAKALREAIDLAVDRRVINDVAFEGRFSPGNQPFPPDSPWYDRGAPVKPRDLDGARAKLKAAGMTEARLEMLVPTDPERQQVAQIMQAMLAEAGITLTIRPTELVSLLTAGRGGGYQAYLVGWSGRADPDLNITPMLGCGAAGNDQPLLQRRSRWASGKSACRGRPGRAEGPLRRCRPDAASRSADRLSLPRQMDLRGPLKSRWAEGLSGRRDPARRRHPALAVGRSRAAAWLVGRAGL